ncbi:MAG: MAPEG family protein [Proteobacteria bacterium]|nr:MAPEG family protein [Pseudomonadota bacterium]
MSIKMILLPVFVEVVLTFILFWWMAYYRVTLIRSRAVHPRDIALRQPNWPPHVLQVANAAHNQLELPVLFYVLTILAIITRKADVLFLTLAWIFVMSRLAHAYVHVTSNRISIRGPVFGIGLLVLSIMWLIFIVEVLAALP